MKPAADRCDRARRPASFVRPAGSVPLRAVAAAVVVLALSGCRGGGEQVDLEPLRAELAAQTETSAALVARIEELESAVGRVDDALGTEPSGVTDLQTVVAGIQDLLVEFRLDVDDLVSGLADETVSRIAADDELADDLRVVRNSVTVLQRSLSDLTTSVQLLREDLAVLERRVENHGHG